MITREIVRIEIYFDNFQEFKDYQNIYEKKGYKIIEKGAGADWYFICEKVED